MNIAPWTVGNPFDFDGEWHTFTYKLTDFVLSTEVKETYTLETWLAEYAMKRNSTFGVRVFPCLLLPMVILCAIMGITHRILSGLA